MDHRQILLSDLEETTPFTVGQLPLYLQVSTYLSALAGKTEIVSTKSKDN